MGLIKYITDSDDIYTGTTDYNVSVGADQRVSLSDFATEKQMRQASKTVDSTITTIVDNFGDTGSFESITTTGLIDDPSGDKRVGVL